MIADHIVIIDGGKIQASDTPQNLIDGMRAAGRISLEIQGDSAAITGALERLANVKIRVLILTS